ncbi:MAG: hypothetical protein IPK82_32720 [Polyangiaceae bacterium]|nr:hypothetical protein [Polyangiaceae bacterium]
MTPFGRLIRDLSPHALLTLSDHLVACESHHHALFLEQAITDALGGEGWGVRQKASFEAWFALLQTLVREAGAATPAAVLTVATDVFSALGHGLLQFEVTAAGGTARGAALYHGHGFLEKYGERMPNRKPLCAFAAGFCSAAASLAYPSDWGILEAEEVSCVGRGDAECTFLLVRKPMHSRSGLVMTRAAAAAMPADLPDPSRDALAAEASRRTARILEETAADGAGSVRLFGVRLALVPTAYTGQITFDTMHLVEKRMMDLFPAYFALVREASTMGAFHTLGGALIEDARRRGVHVSRDPTERLAIMVGAARALGWGGFYVTEHRPGKHLSLAAAVTHESAYYAARHGGTIRQRLAAHQGIAVAMTLLLADVDFRRPDPILPSTYSDLMAGPVRHHVEEVHSVLRGDSHSEVSVETLHL